MLCGYRGASATFGWLTAAISDVRRSIFLLRPLIFVIMLPRPYLSTRLKEFGQTFFPPDQGILFDGIVGAQMVAPGKPVAKWGVTLQ